ncbi:MAG: MFS transporter, partial [Planctomycetes bacterium]|nr:MFS transporter [Planctomycetota bacterium]
MNMQDTDPERPPVRLQKDPLPALLVAQFFGAFNDNAFKMIVVLLAMRAVAAGDEAGAQYVATMAFVVFTLPLLLGSLPAMLLGDRVGKRDLIVWTKAAEVLLMAGGALALWWQPTGALGFVVLAGMGLQSALFAPGKYGILPELLPHERLTAANGRLEAASFLAIILGTVSGGLLLDLAGPRPWLELSIAVTNRSRGEIELVGFPAGARLQRGAGRHLVYPFQSGALLPLDERFGRMRIYGSLPFVHGYPSNLCAMQWLGAVGPRVAWMLQGTDRYGALTRTGAVESDGAAVLVWEHQASLPPGETFAPPPLRLHSFPAGDWHDLADAYRRWITERRADGATVVRDGERIPLQFVPFRAKLAARPRLAQVMTTHGYPEHAIREQPDGTPFAYLPYGLVLALQERFERLYDSPLTPQLWSPLVPGGHGWRLF